ncbi:MAG: hypothetical protein KME10_19695 [Plectolyngbya sp. WJT66-NPBG17]|jgi:hypothetical protein|nr:hypothetical protein [Plectolyngbya sp. WJT66-NPBG17]MBW4528278.1 hypothetical protein [Phormidium tanganyikae FI6-MK23]
MNLTDTLDIRGRLSIQVYNLEGELLETTIANNSIVQTGRQLVAERFVSSQMSQIKPISQIAVGTGSQDVQPIDRNLHAQVGDRKAIKVGNFEDMITWKEVDGIARCHLKISADLEPTEYNADLTEAGLFNEDGVMYNRVVFPAIRKTPAFRLTLLWQILF